MLVKFSQNAKALEFIANIVLADVVGSIVTSVKPVQL